MNDSKQLIKTIKTIFPLLLPYSFFNDSSRSGFIVCLYLGTFVNQGSPSVCSQRIKIT